MNYSGQDLVLTLMACGVHVGITAREKDETVSVKTSDGKVTSVATGKKTFDSYKGMDYNVKTILRMFRDEDGQVCCVVEKDRMKCHPAGTVLEDPSLLDWASVISKNKDRKDFTVKNDLDAAIETDQKIFEKQMLGNDAPIEDKNEDSNDIHDLQAKIKSIISSLPVPEKQAKRAALKEAGLPDKFNNVTDDNVLNKILEVVSQ